MILGTGIDIIEVERIAQAIKRWGDRFLTHIFCDEEIRYAKKHKNPSQHFAARFAAKEAILKAIGDNAHVRWKDMKILNEKSGKPFCIYSNKNFKHKILLSLTHTKSYAAATCIITS